MTFKLKLWMGVGAFAIAGTAAPGLATPVTGKLGQRSATAGIPVNQEASAPIRLAQAGDFGGEGGEGGEKGVRTAPSPRPAAKRPFKTKFDQKGGHHHKPRSGGAGGENGSVRPYAFGGKRRGGEHGAARPSEQGGEGGERGHALRTALGGEGGEYGQGRVNSRYIFGFTEGADVESRGEREFESDTIMRFGKRAGEYAGLRNKTEFEYGVTNELLLEIGSFLSYNRIRNVPDLQNRDAANFDGLSAELKYRILDRANSPFGLGISAEPEWSRFSGTSGRRENGYGLETKLYVDKELIPRTLFVAANLIYEPEAVNINELDPATGRIRNWERESTFGVSGAANYAVMPGLFLGGEVRYLVQYSGTYLNRFEGDALFLGPTVSWRFRPNAVLIAAYSAQIKGSIADEPIRRLNLTNFERQQARLRLVYEF